MLNKDVSSYLQDRNVYYTEISIKSIVSSSALEDHAFKSILLRSTTGYALSYALAVIPIKNKVDLTKCKRILNVSHISLASRNDLRNIMKCEPGSCYPFGRLRDIDIILDMGDLLIDDTMYFGSGTQNIIVSMLVCEYLRCETPIIANIKL